MLTRKEIEKKGLRDGKDYIYLGDVRYREGDKFERNGKEVGVRKIIDDYHFIASNGESWHTGMFYEQGCSHGRDMIPLEFDPRMFDKAEERLKNHQIYHTEVYAMKDGRIEHNGTLIARYDSRHNDFRAELGEEISRSFLSLEASLALICPDYAEELRCIVQE